MYNKYTTAAKQWRLCSHQSFVSCLNAKLGCTEDVSLGKESLHKKECNFCPCSCPVQDCNFAGSYVDLYGHYNLCAHQDTQFRMDTV